jgi:hypothetical protein
MKPEFIGIDGCKRGWFYVATDNRGVQFLHGH